MKQKIKVLYKTILSSNSSNFEIAYGFAIGIFVGFIPAYGFQTIISIILALVFRNANRISLIFATQLFLPPVIPLVIALDYTVGSIILFKKIEFLKIKEITDILIYIKPIFVGSIIVAPIMGLLFGIIFYYILKHSRKFIDHNKNNIENKNSIDKTPKMQ